MEHDQAAAARSQDAAVAAGSYRRERFRLDGPVGSALQPIGVGLMSSPEFATPAAPVRASRSLRRGHANAFFRTQEEGEPP
jgi:hypothetical protein